MQVALIGRLLTEFNDHDTSLLSDLLEGFPLVDSIPDDTMAVLKSTLVPQQSSYSLSTQSQKQRIKASTRHSGEKGSLHSKDDTSIWEQTASEVAL